MEDNSQVSWLDLPHELWPVIGQCLDTYIDVLRFRSVCRLWRNSLPKLEMHSLFCDPKLEIYSLFSESLLFQSIIYCFTPLDHHHSKGFLAMIDNKDLCFRRIDLNNESNNREKNKNVNFLDFRISKVASSTQANGFLVKILVFPNKNIIVGLHCNGWLFFIRELYGENFLKSQNWGMIDGNANYDDIIVYNDQMYTINRKGEVFLIDSFMRLLQISDAISLYGDLKHLVECGGEIYAVDRCVEMTKSQLDLYDSFWYSIRTWCHGRFAANSIDFKVHRLDQRRQRWVEVENLGNQAFVLGVDCFSISAPADHLRGFESNCIYFLNDVNSCFSRAYKNSIHVFDLQKSTIEKLCKLRATKS